MNNEGKTKHHDFTAIRDLILYGDPIGVILMRAESIGIDESTARYILNILVEFEWAIIRGNYYFFHAVRFNKDEFEVEWNDFIIQNG